MPPKSLHITALAWGLAAFPAFAEMTVHEQLADLSLSSAETLVGGVGKIGEDGTFPTIGYLTDDLDPQLIPCDGDGSPLPSEDVQGFLDACEAGMMMIRAEVSDDARAAAAEMADTLALVGITRITQRWGEDICGVWSDAPFPLEGQAIGAFMENKAACAVLLDTWYEDVTQGVGAE